MNRAGLAGFRRGLDEESLVEALRHRPGVTAVYWTSEPDSVAAIRLDGAWIVEYGDSGEEALRRCGQRVGTVVSSRG